jgi:hypothetical protein
VNNTNSRLPHTKKKQKRHTASKVEKMFYDFLLLASVVEEHSVKTVISLRFVLIFGEIQASLLNSLRTIEVIIESSNFDRDLRDKQVI